MKKYTVKHPVSIYLGILDNDCLLMLMIRSENAEEDLALSDDGEYACWDSVAKFVDEGVRIIGEDAPGGGSQPVEIFVPQLLVRAIEVTVD
jgi:hypothetical protein